MDITARSEDIDDPCVLVIIGIVAANLVPATKHLLK
jgi:hypothetical protein